MNRDWSMWFRTEYLWSPLSPSQLKHHDRFYYFGISPFLLLLSENPWCSISGKVIGSLVCPMPGLSSLVLCQFSSNLQSSSLFFLLVKDIVLLAGIVWKKYCSIFWGDQPKKKKNLVNLVFPLFVLYLRTLIFSCPAPIKFFARPFFSPSKKTNNIVFLLFSQVS